MSLGFSSHIYAELTVQLWATSQEFLFFPFLFINIIFCVESLLVLHKMTNSFSPEDTYPTGTQCKTQMTSLSKPKGGDNQFNGSPSMNINEVRSPR